MLKAYKRTTSFTEHTVPAGLLREHRTRTGTWADITVESGSLRVDFPSEREGVTLSAGEVSRVAPGEIHEVTPIGPVLFHVVFLREDDQRQVHPVDASTASS